MEQKIDKSFLKDVNTKTGWWTQPKDAPKDGFVNVGDIELGVAVELAPQSFDMRAVCDNVDRVEVSVIKRF